MDEYYSPLWRRLDTAGHDACRILPHKDGLRLSGHAVFRHEDGRPASLAYSVDCDGDWVSLAGRVQGFIDRTPVDVTITRRDGQWIQGEKVWGLADCQDLDFGFTPATNILQLKRENMPVGEHRLVPAAWFDLDCPMIRLPQTYERLSETRYHYTSPQGGYDEVLEIREDGWVIHYPRLWRAEPMMSARNAA